MTTWQKRVASALVLGPVAFLIIWYGGWPFAAFIIFLIVLALYEWVQLALRTEQKILLTALGVVYVLLSFWCCYRIRMNYSPEMALLFISMVWASDVGAYLTGKTIGGPKMASEISPNKTWAGYGGALIFPALTALALSAGYVFIFRDGAWLSALQVTVLSVAGVIVGLVGQSGDLVISFLKRRAKVKDTGQLIPGHGGLLDRIDSLMLAAPVFLFIISRFYHVYHG